MQTLWLREFRSIVVFHFPSPSPAIHIIPSIPVAEGGKRSDAVAVLLYAQDTTLRIRRPLVVEAVMFFTGIKNISLSCFYYYTYMCHIHITLYS